MRKVYMIAFKLHENDCENFTRTIFSRRSAAESHIRFMETTTNPNTNWYIVEVDVI